MAAQRECTCTLHFLTSSSPILRHISTKLESLGLARHNARLEVGACRCRLGKRRCVTRPFPCSQKCRSEADTEACAEKRVDGGHWFLTGLGFRIGVPGMRSRNAPRNAEFWVSRAFPFRVPRSVETLSFAPQVPSLVLCTSSTLGRRACGHLLTKALCELKLELIRANWF
jgi:hypothetical protein